MSFMARTPVHLRSILPPRVLVADVPAGIELVRAVIGTRAIVWGVSDHRGGAELAGRGAEALRTACRPVGAPFLDYVDLSRRCGEAAARQELSRVILLELPPIRVR